MTEERIVCHTPTPGKQPTSIPVWKYVAIIQAILNIMPDHEPGIAAKNLPDLVAAELDAKTRSELGSVTWHTTTVKLHMEVEGELNRVPKVKPQHLIRT